MLLECPPERHRDFRPQLEKLVFTILCMKTYGWATDSTNRKPAVRLAGSDICPQLASVILQSPDLLFISLVAHRLQMFPSDKQAGRVKVVLFFPVAPSLMDP